MRRFTRNLQRMTWTACCVAVTALVGCGSTGTQEISGTVTLDGKEIEEGQIEFVPIESTKGPTAGAPIQQGKFTVPAVANGLVTNGVYRVSISSMVGSGQFSRNPVAPGGKSEALKESIPSRYNEASELKITVSPNPAENTHVFQLISS